MTPSTSEHARFWDALGKALGAGTRLTGALESAGKTSASADLEETARDLVKRLERGQPLSVALSCHPTLFESILVETVRSAELSGTLDLAASQIAGALRTGDLASLVPDAQASMEDPLDAGISEAVNGLFQEAVRTHASDIHVDPLPDGTGAVRLRIDGVLQPQDPLTKDTLPQVIARLKVRANMDVAETRRPQVGRIPILDDTRRLDLRLATSPTVHGERIVIRVLDPEQVRLSLNDILPDDENVETLRSLARRPHGLVIVNGPTGSGKTTTLYCMLAEVNAPGRSVVTVEDPVEYVIPGVTQMQIAPEIGFTFRAAQETILRQDPDVVMVGEIRDLEQLQLAVQTAITGHLVLTTLHARSAAEAVIRLLDIGLEPFLVNASLEAVISQLLVRRLCPECREAVDLDETLLPPELIEFVGTLEDPRFFEPRGCDVCRHTGFRGRTAIHEILTMDDDLREVVAGRPDAASVREAARQGGMRTFLESGLVKAARGITTVEEVLRVATAR